MFIPLPGISSSPVRSTRSISITTALLLHYLLPPVTPTLIAFFNMHVQYMATIDDELFRLDGTEYITARVVALFGIRLRHGFFVRALA